jgi:hypothetical protein
VIVDFLFKQETMDILRRDVQEFDILLLSVFYTESMLIIILDLDEYLPGRNTQLLPYEIAGDPLRP